MNQNDHFIPQFYLRLWQFSPGKVYVHWLEERRGRSAIEPRAIKRICSERSYLDLLDETGNNVSYLDAMLKPVESDGAQVVKDVAGGVRLEGLDPARKEALFKWLACIGPLGPNGKQACIWSAANYLAAVIHDGAALELSKFFPFNAAEIVQWAKMKEATAKPYTLELRVGAQQLWQARVPALINHDYHDQKNLQWIEITRGAGQDEAVASDCLPLVTDLGPDGSATLFPIGPEKMLLGLSNPVSPEDVKGIQAGGWNQFREVAVAKASEYIVGRSEYPAIFAAHERLRAEDPRLEEHRKREKQLRNIGGRLAVRPKMITHTSVVPFHENLVDSTCDDPRGNRFIVRFTDPE